MKDEKQYPKTFLYGLIAGSLVFIFLAFLLGTYIGFDAGKKHEQTGAVTPPLPLTFSVDTGTYSTIAYTQNKLDSSIEIGLTDGEGNAIPSEAVKILVRSQFVWVSQKEDSLLHKYFYGTECKHKVIP